MMKKNKLAVLGLSAVLGLNLGITSVLADESGDTGTKSATSKSNITLTASGDDSDPVAPIVPDDPSNPTGQTGPLTIDNASTLNFGTQEISSKEEVYTTTTVNPNVQVSDHRGTGAGWTLQVSLSKFTTSANKELKGAVLTLPAGEMKTTDDNVSAPATASVVTLNADGTATNATVMSAAANQGMGTWADSFDQSGVKLTVPAGNLAGAYSSTLTWSLVDAPQS